MIIIRIWDESPMEYVDHIQFKTTADKDRFAESWKAKKEELSEKWREEDKYDEDEYFNAYLETIKKCGGERIELETIDY